MTVGTGSYRHRVGLVSLPTGAVDAVDLIVRAERAELDTVWLEMSGTDIDALTVFAAAATGTERVRLGTAIVPAFTRHPVTLATQAFSLEGLAPGRLRLGIGTGNAKRMKVALGHPLDRPLARLNEYLRVLRPVLQEGAAVFAGEFYAADVQFPKPTGTPVLLAALGPRAFGVAGELADGALSWLCPVPYLLEVAMPAMIRGAQRAGRPTPPLVAHVAVAIGSDPVAVREAARQDVERYARVPVFAWMFAAAGYPVDGGVSDALVDALVVTGDEDKIGSQLVAILDSGIDELMVSVTPGADLRHDEDVVLRILSGVG